MGFIETVHVFIRESAIYFINTNDFHEKENIINFLNNYNTTNYYFDPEHNYFQEFKNEKATNPLTIPIVFAEKYDKENFGITAFPATIIIGKNGKVYTAMIGYFEAYDE